ncbi:MAG TPA: imidazole glycerol phosphate synthase subunit HisF [Candidatus Obscuribacterales bacterium]
MPTQAPAHSDLCKRIIPCLDVANGRTVKGVRFANLRDIGDPAVLAAEYERQGADELMFLDITATKDNRSTMTQVVTRVAEQLSIPFSVGGGVSSLEDARRLLECGADKVTVNSAAVRNPKLIAEIAERYGSQSCVLSIDARRQKDSGEFEVLIAGGSIATGRDALSWARAGVRLGAGEILLTSWDKDGTLSGFDVEMVSLFSRALPVPVVASGGARGPQCFIDVFQSAGADAALAATIFHDGVWTISALKQQVQQAGVNVRPC